MSQLIIISYMLSTFFQGPIIIREHRSRNHLLKNLFPSIPVPWVGNLLILKWSKKDGMLDIRHHEIPTICRTIET